ncbi:MAG: serine/threonine-protein kinase, partial [Bryobacterales bacterium]|nr:serine/threonine-protein kinase [Bryobacterales bacterium]
MPMAAGDQLGPYEVLAPLGAGGMGEVYRARDTRLGRTVAVKVLPAHIAQREDARSRFEREARAVASLNHPHICTLHDIGPNYMVLELIEGETLAARIEKGALPLDQALKYAVQIADALDRAHRAGVTHRDVKPQNIMLTRDGVKVLDFGLAKSTAKPAPTQETLTDVLTTEGTVLGTPQYMAPEQFEGREADARSDIWAFGAVLYEMVTGRKAFVGKSYTSLVAAILGGEPAPMAVKPFTPAWLERLVRRCLEKDPEDRWQSMRDIVLELRSPGVEVAAVKKASYWPWAVAACLAVALAAVLFVHFRETIPEQPALTTSINPPDNAAFNETAISPDGKMLAFTATTADGKRQLWLRPLDALTARALEGTDRAEAPFWSPDSRWIGFFAQEKLKKIEAGGGPVQTLCDVATPRGGAWNAEGVILVGSAPGPLFRVPAQGGTPAPITTIDPANGERSHRWPVFVAGGRNYLYLSGTTGTATKGIFLGTLDGQEPTRLVEEYSNPGYTEGPAGEGYLLFARAGTLMAQRLDTGKRALVGEAFPVMERVDVDPRGRAPFTVSGNGMLAVEPGSSAQARLAWMDRTGKRLDWVGELGAFGLEPVLSPDEKQVAFFLKGDIWVRDLARGISTRLTFDSRLDRAPVWSPDGGRIVFSAIRDTGLGDLYVKSASGAGQEELLLTSGNDKRASDWAGGGRGLLYREIHPKTKRDLWLLPMEGERKPVPLLRTEFNESDGAFSPD